MRRAGRQTPAPAGRLGVGRGKAASGPSSDEARRPRHEPESPGSGLLNAALARENLQRAWKRVRANKGAAGVDGLDIDQTAAHLRTVWPLIRDQLLAGTYRPMPVRRVTIPKPDGGERELGVPTVTDRLIQQALLQVLQPVLDPSFSEHSYGFRPGRSAQDAVLAAQSYVQSGRRIVVDVDLEKFFDRVNHDILIDRLQKRIGDAGVVRLIRAYLNSGIMMNGVVQERVMGTPQGGPLSPLLANVLLDEVDKELERRGHCFVRYADDANIYIRSRKAGERVMALLRRLYGALRLAVNETKSAVASVFGRKFLGYAFWAAPGGAIKRRVANKPMATFKRRIRQLRPPLRRAQHGGCGGAAAILCAGLEGLLPAGADAASLEGVGPVATPPGPRRPTQAVEARQNHPPGAAGAGSQARRSAESGGQSRCWWRNSGMLLNAVLTLAWADKLGIPRLS